MLSYSPLRLILGHTDPQERLLSYERLEDRDSRKDVSHSRPTWNLFKRVLSRWRWYACSLLVRCVLLHDHVLDLY